jgi:hypothetical protein
MMNSRSLFSRFGLIHLSVPLLLCLMGCQKRSISNAGYGGAYGGGSLYRGELTQFEVLGVGRDQNITEEAIAKALDTPMRVALKRTKNVLLVQSGAMIPDEAMLAEFGRNAIKVIPFSGVPTDAHRGDISRDSTFQSTYGQSLRLAAARGGCESILCYWGVLESARKDFATKTVSWVPIIGMAMPDEQQLMRIRLVMALVDVRTGNWAVYSPQPLEDKAVSTTMNREASDQLQVEKLKQAAYEAAVKELLRTYGD